MEKKVTLRESNRRKRERRERPVGEFLLDQVEGFCGAASFAARDSFIVEDPFSSTFTGYLVNQGTLGSTTGNEFFRRHS